MKMWPKNTRPTIEPHEITAMLGRPGKNRRKDSDEPVKKKFGKATRKGRKMKCSKYVGTLYAGTSTAGTSAAIAGISSATTGTSDATAETNAATSDLTNAAIRSQSSVNAGPSVGPSARRPTNASSSGVRPAIALTSGGRPTNATSSDMRPVTTSTFCGRPTTTPLSTQQSTSSAAGQNRKISTLRGGSVTERSGNIDRVLYSATLSSSTPTNIDLGYKLNGLRWKGGVAVTQRQLREDSYRSTQGTTNTHATPNTQGTHSISLCLA
ncbi:hypothetical protein KY289_027511 [Solanum tuberosum]|nr:hypothetical protein KY289_027511 [Solanum tuberosum]KAH0662364.1 hypothetical protein KY284_027295 [Solanum tuberosum]